jgi:hypothetical protein
VVPVTVALTDVGTAVVVSESAALPASVAAPLSFVAAGVDSVEFDANVGGRVDVVGGAGVGFDDVGEVGSSVLLVEI